MKKYLNRKTIKIALYSVCAISFLILAIILLTGCGGNNLQKASEKLSTYNIVVDYNDEKQTLSCLQTLNYVNSQNDATLNYICLHLYPNAFREGSLTPPVSALYEHKAYPNGKSYGDIIINSVNINGKNALLSNDESALTYKIAGTDHDILFVYLENAIYPNESVNLELTYDVNLPNINHRFGYGENTVNIANFYPIACVYENGEFNTLPYNYNGDPFYSDMANYTVKLTCASDFIVSHSGNLNYELNNEGKKTIELSAVCIRDFALVLSKEFEVITTKVGNIDVNYYYFDDEKSEQSLETSVLALKTFNELIGIYPYQQLSVVQANFVHGGMEYPNLIYVSNEVEDYTSYTKVIVHEIAHQWWYGLVGNDEFTNSWLDEGLTEFSTAMFFDKNPQYEITKQSIMNDAYNSYSNFSRVYGEILGDINTSLSRKLNEFNTEPEYVYSAYVKGMLLFSSIENLIGEEKFEKCLQKYFEIYSFKNVAPADLIACFSKVSGRNLENVFNSWIDGKVILAIG